MKLCFCIERQNKTLTLVTQDSVYRATVQEPFTNQDKGAFDECIQFDHLLYIDTEERRLYLNDQGSGMYILEKLDKEVD
ncbi:hypothetical protein [uncultured Abiotrophia sp.]|uniref:hypothetical protein n=1 Tax=uncultured Abiotrophia sp. TaxID=316094 RepID=UPI0028D4A796|nr:hypothetical protein [uncultured Abiotrophia sp.]